MSVSYPQLDFTTVPPSTADAPPCENGAIFNDRDRQYALSCAMCQKPFAEIMGATCVLACRHIAHLLCSQIMIHEKNVRDINALGGLSHCNHCRSRAVDLGQAAVAENDPEVTYEFCIERMRQLHSERYKTGDLDSLSFAQLTMADIKTMLGESATTQTFNNIAKSVGGGIGKWFGAAPAEPETVWSAVPDYSTVPHGDEFVKLMREKKRTIDDVFATLKYTLAHLFSAGVQTVEQLRELGFSPSRHLRSQLRAVFPLHLLVQKYGFSYDKDMRAQMTNDELAASGLEKYELPLIELKAHHLVERKLNADQLARFGNLTLDDWIRFSGLQLPHAVAMGITAEKFERYWPQVTQRNDDSSAYLLYVAICKESGVLPRTFASAATQPRRKKKQR